MNRLARRRLPRPTAALLACLLLAACSGAAPGNAGATPPATGSGSPGTPSGAAATVAVALDLVCSNRYSEADRAFAAAITAMPSDPDAHAGYALYLNYTHDFDGALREARLAVGVGPRSGHAYAVLCRVHDWSNRLDDALGAGRTAIRLAPKDALAHLFLSEALADHGDLPGARAEIAAAAGVLGSSGSVYERAELHREQGNLGHDSGDLAGELSAYRAAFDAQPRWVERPAELASAFLDNNDLTGAHTALQTALSLTPGDAGLLSSVGRISLLQSDYVSAAGAFTRLIALRPRDPMALELAAHTAMAAHGDIGGAVTLLQRALTSAPADVEAAAYLIALERDVRGDEARGRAEVAAAVAAAHDEPGRGTPVVAPDVDARQASHRASALDELNRARLGAGLPAVGLDSRLSASALSHCFYWLFNNGSPGVAKLGIHLETAGLPGFTGRNAGDRALHFGWRLGGLGEDITHRGDPVMGVRDWIDSVFHRFPMMRSDLSKIGYADCGVGPLPMEDMEFGFAAPDGGAHAPVAYPADGQTKVPAVFVDNELPDPVPAGRPRTTGYPVTVTFDPQSLASVSSFTLADAAGHALDAYLLQPGPSTENSASLLPVAALTAGGRYTARLRGSVDRRPLSMTWSFTVAPA